MSEEAWEFCRSILPGVSRSFALTIPVLDGELYRPVLINYLIDRLLDNFEDELDRDNFSLDERKMMMDKVVKLFNPASKDYFAEVNEIKEYGKMMPVAPLRELTEKVILLRKAYDTLEKVLKDFSHKWLREMNLGMQKYLTVKIRDFEDLNEYCYYVAGTVGGFLTDLVLHLSDVSVSYGKELQSTFNSSGLFLQKINLVRDVRRDYLEQGRVFWPLEELGISNSGLFKRKNKETALLALKKMLDDIKTHIPDLVKYLGALPDNLPGYRQFYCINNGLALATLSKMENNPAIFYGKKPVKVSRFELQKLLKAPEETFKRRVAEFFD